MKLETAALLFALLASSASAQTVLDGSDKRLPLTSRRALPQAIAALTYYPREARLKDLRPGPNGVICGYLSSSRPDGSYNGFGPFYVRTDRRDGLYAVPSIPELYRSSVDGIRAACGLR